MNKKYSSACIINNGSSRMCENGTKSCIVDHKEIKRWEDKGPKCEKKVFDTFDYVCWKKPEHDGSCSHYWPCGVCGSNTKTSIGACLGCVGRNSK